MKSSTRKQILSGIFGGFFVSVLILLGYAGVTQMPTLIAKLKHAQDPSIQSLVQSSQKIGGTQYFVDPAGHDNNDGTSVISAFATIQKAINKALPGDTIYLADGQYVQDFKTVRSGTDGSPIIITGSPQALVVGSGESRIAEINHSFIQLIGFTIDGLVGDPAVEGSYRDKLLYIHGTQPRVGLQGIKILKMTLQNGGGECMRLRYFVQGAEIAYNTIGPCGVHDFTFAAGGKNGEAIYIGTAPEQLRDGKNPTQDPDESNRNSIHHNTIDTQGNECVDIKEASRFNIVEYNTCTGQKDPESAGLDSRGSNNIFRYNDVSGSVGAGVRLGGDEDTDGIRNDVYGNTLRSNKYGGIKVERIPQGKVCDNKITGTPSIRFVVGSESEDINPTQPCR